jgi:hypothetical protein
VFCGGEIRVLSITAIRLVVLRRKSDPDTTCFVLLGLGVQKCKNNKIKNRFITIIVNIINIIFVYYMSSFMFCKDLMQSASVKEHFTNRFSSVVECCCLLF